MTLAGEVPVWFEDAPCRGVDSAIFYPEWGRGAGAYKEAKSYCEPCPYRSACLEWALDYEGDAGKERRHGMFGGLTPSQRADMRRPQVCEICEAEFHYFRKTPTCSERCWKVREARYQHRWQQQNRGVGLKGGHGSNLVANSGCTCAVCRNHRRARAREERVRKTIRDRETA